jgi:alcohol dehydrogenase class IV
VALVEWFEFQVRGRVVCAEHCVDGIGLEMDRAGGTRVLLVTDGGVREAGLDRAVAEGMQSGSAEVFGVFDEVPPGSEVSAVESCYDMVKKAGADSLISLGGGSVIDTTKATAILMVEGGRLIDHHSAVYFPSGPMPPHIAVPTTAGTGSESTGAAVIADGEQRLKLTFQSPELAPRVSMLDPVMTATLPPGLTASTGMDALTHCVEAIHSRRHEPISDGLALQAIRLISVNLPRAVRDGSDIEARTGMLLAANMGGMAVANAQPGIVQAMSNACGGRFGAEHGATSSVLLPYAMEFNLSLGGQEVQARYRSVAEALGVDVREDDDLTAANRAIEAIRDFAAELGLPVRLRELGIPGDRLEPAAGDSMREGSMFNNPGECESEEVLEVLKRAY